jgi:hypothetical protein
MFDMAKNRNNSLIITFLSQFCCCFVVEWYKGKIISADANQATWAVVFDDGENDDALCQWCVRAYQPYHTGENIDWRDENDQYMPGVILARTYNEKIGENYRIRIYSDDGNQHSHNSNRTVEGVVPADLRRHVLQHHGNNTLPYGTRVQALYSVEEGWYPGIIEAVNDDGTYQVQYDDGDVDESVPLSHIRIP